MEPCGTRLIHSRAKNSSVPILTHSQVLLDNKLTFKPKAEQVIRKAAAPSIQKVSKSAVIRPKITYPAVEKVEAMKLLGLQRSADLDITEAMKITGEALTSFRDCCACQYRQSYRNLQVNGKPSKVVQVSVRKRSHEDSNLNSAGYPNYFCKNGKPG